MLVSPLDEVKLNQFDSEYQAQPVYVEGKITNIIAYQLKDSGTSLLQIYRNYVRALEKLNAEVMFSCFREDCELGALDYTLWTNEQDDLFKGLYVNIGMDQEIGVITATLKQPASPQKWLSIVVGGDDYNKFRSVALSVVESDKLDDNLLKVISLEDLQSNFEKDGKIVLDGIYFDHDRSEVKADSAEAMEAIASYLRENEEMNVYFVGHTDTTGSEHHNVKLSEKRANAVVARLVEDYQLSQERLKARGVGPYAPVASNHSEDGKTLNRRVEMVRDDG